MYVSHNHIDISQTNFNHTEKISKQWRLECQKYLIANQHKN